MLPTVSIGSLTLPVYPMVWAVAMFVAGALAFRRMLQAGIQPEQASHGVLWTVWGGLLGAFVSRVVLSLSQSVALSRGGTAHGGLSFVGVLLGGGLAGYLNARRSHNMRLMRALDLGWVPVPLAQAIGRLGCLAAGCCYGKLTDSWLGLRLPDSHGVWAVRYPTRLLSIAANLTIFGVLVAFERFGKRRQGSNRTAPPGRTWPFDGALFLLYAMLYNLKRFLIQFLRADNVPVIGPFSTTHLLTGAMLITAMAIALWRIRATRVASQAAS